MKNNEFIDAVLNSTTGMNRAEAPDVLWDKIRAAIQEEIEIVKMVPRRTVFWAAASIVLLVCMNFLAVRNHQVQSKSGVELLIEQYQIK